MLYLKWKYNFLIVNKFAIIRLGKKIYNKQKLFGNFFQIVVAN